MKTKILGHFQICNSVPLSRTRVALVLHLSRSFLIHLVLVPLASHWCCTCVAFVLLMFHSCHIYVDRVALMSHVSGTCIVK